ARTVEVHRLELVAVPDADTAVFDCECGKGTYVRAMARDMGRRLGSRGHVIGLRRLLVCLVYRTEAAGDLKGVVVGGRRIIKR
ncbi:hypothetical protein J8J40_32505, partial [Mycobacterium tuberculosis]|nr:hypothetical protein [Mycobacterium tuberculosis]